MKRRGQFVGLAFLVILQVCLASSVSPHFGHTGDENAHLTGGYTYWKFNDYRLHPENGNLAQRWVALPLLAMELTPPGPDTPGWEDGAYWPVSNRFLYESGHDLPRLLAAGRLMNALLGGALVLVVFGWARSLFGPWGGAISAVLAAFCPHLLAHAGLANSDITISLAFPLALLAWWRLLHRVTAGRIGLAGLAVGALALAKYSAVFFAPIAVLLALVRLTSRAPLGGRRSIAGRLGVLVVASGAALLLAWAIVWAAYGFRFDPTPDGRDPGNWDWAGVIEPVDDSLDLVGPAIGFAREHRLLPAAWLYGLGYVDRKARYRQAFLAGECSATGWPEFFPVAFLIKTTLGAQALLLLALLLPWFCPRRRTLRWLYRLAPLLVFLGVFGAFAITSKINIGHRHILPLYPALYIIAGSLGAVLAARPRRGWLVTGVAALLAWHLVASWKVRPHYLAYFNESIGGPAAGYRYLVDSSLDWGQGLPDLQRWLATHARDERVYLAYFGTDRPSRFGLRAIRLGDRALDSEPRSPPPERLEPGLYCISATLLQQVYALGGGRWSAALERRYQTLRARPLDLVPPAAVAGGPDPAEEFSALRFGRLCHFLRRREPDAQVGYAILIYRVSGAELQRYLEGPPTP